MLSAVCVMFVICGGRFCVRVCFFVERGPGLCIPGDRMVLVFFASRSISS